MRRFDPGQLEGAAAKLWPDEAAERSGKKKNSNHSTQTAPGRLSEVFMLAGVAFEDFQVEKDKHWKTHENSAN